MLKRQAFTIAFISWMVFVTWSSLSSFSDTDLPLFDVPNIDKIVHFTFYFVAVILGTMASREFWTAKISVKKTLIIMLLSMVTFGILIEVCQYSFTVDRTGDKYDALANGIGAICGTLIMKIVFSRYLGLKWEQ